MKQPLVIGYGNPLCGDDGVAWHIAELLSPLFAPGVVNTIHQLTPEWAEPVSRAGHVVFVDAAVDGIPGEIRCIPIAPAAKQHGSHEMTPDGLLGMALELYGACPPAQLVAVSGLSFELSESLSAEVAASVPLAATMIHEVVEKTEMPGEKNLLPGI